MKLINPADVPQPASQYSQAVLLSGSGERLVISGQIGIRADGTIVDGLEGQMEQAWRNVLAIVRDAGFERQHLTRLVIYVTQPGSVGVYRSVRDRMLKGHRCANTYLEISGLALPELLCEIEGEAEKPA
ncbi:MAG: RidA family protein [Pseudomonadota bacterium]